MKVLAFNGSSRRDGNSQALLAEAIRGVKEQGAEVTVYNLNDANICLARTPAPVTANHVM